MAQGGGSKRKRGDRTFSQDSRDEGPRPSPHRPGNLSLGRQANAVHSPQQQNFNQEQLEQRGGGRRRGSRGGRGGGPAQRGSPINSPNTMPVTSRISTPAKALSPPLPPTPAPPFQGDKAATQQLPPTTEIATQTPEDQPTSLPYQYDLITEDALRRWDQSGRSSVISAGLEARNTEDAVTLSTVFQELVRSNLDARLDTAEAASTVKEILQQDSTEESNAEHFGFDTPFDVVALFLDCLSVIDEPSLNASSLRSFVIATGVTPLRLRLGLGEETLTRLGLVRTSFDRMSIRKQTNLIYRQSNHNLLREETEGFSKMITELFTTSSNETLTPQLVDETFEHIKGMIGAFDMDVGRVLDVTLDVFAAVLVKQYRFFVKLFRTSSWWPQQSSYQKSSSGNASDTLPRWALPGAPCHTYSVEEKAEIACARDERDRKFWTRAREIGMAAFFEITGRRVESPVSEAFKAVERHEPARESDGASDTIPPTEVERRWIEETGTLPPQGNYMAAQILGFKLCFYTSSARGLTDVLPDNLIYLAALLIKIGFISLMDLYPHLWPPDDAMEAVREEKMKEKAEKEKLNRPGGGALNALASAGALPDDMPPMPVGRLRDSDRLREVENIRNSPAAVDGPIEKAPPTVEADTESELPEPSDQKVQLLKSLLCIGALPEALYVLGRFPWLPEAFTELPDYIHRILHHSLSKVYEPLRPLQKNAEIRDQQKGLDPDQSGIAKGILKHVDSPPRKTLRWAQLDKEDTNEGIDYRFYWDDWSDMIPVCQTVDDVFVLCKTLLNYTGVKIGKDPLLLTKLARIGKHSLANDPSEANRARWFDLLKRLIVPALSMTKNNPGVVNAVYELLKCYSTMERYSVYTEWYQGQTSRLPDIKSAFEQVKAETKDVLKRVSKTNVRPMARALGRVAAASPGIVFQVAISQIESYDNLIDTVSECARYFTYLSYDVLTWSLISSLGARGRIRMQADGMLTSKWLQAISLFSGKMFKRWTVMNPTPILQYVTDQLRQSNPTDLIVLEQITINMAGIVSDTNFNEAQVLAMAGGDLLQSQTMLQLHDERHKHQKSSKGLLRALTGPRLAGQLLIAIAQERQTCVYKFPEQNAPLKVLGNQFDELHRIFVQYLDLLRTNLSIQEFDDLVPSVSNLIIDFGLEPNIAFYIARPGITAAMSEHDTATAKIASGLKRSPIQEPKEDVKDTEARLRTGDTNTGVASSAEGEGNDQDGAAKGSNEPEDDGKMEVDAKETKSANPTPVQSPPTVLGYAQQPWHPVLHGLMDAIESALPKDTWEVLSQSFFVTFWSLSLCDMLVPTQSYDDEINRLKKKIVAINNDRSDVGKEKKEKEKKTLNDTQDRLRAELKDQVQTYSQTRSRLQKEKEAWFSDFWGKWEPLNAAILEQCFFPRLTLSPVDALYVFKLFKYLHSSGATNFRSMGLLDQLFNEKRLTSVLFLCTAKEAENFGRFLNEVLRDLGRWHADKVIFEKEAYGTKKDLPGFAKRLDMDTAKKPVEFLSFEEFRRIMLKWHRNLHFALKTSFTSGEYMRIRNAINVLRAIYQHFPVVNYMGTQQVASITQLSKTENREDLKIAAASLLGNLKRREKDWILPQAFNLNEIPMNGVNGQRGASAKPTTPQPDAETKTLLNPKAADFQPGSRLSTDGASEPSAHTVTQAQIDAEDGEINDAKMVDAPPDDNTAAAQKGAVAQIAQEMERPKSETIQPLDSNTGDASAQALSRSSTPNQDPTKAGAGSTTSVTAPTNLAPVANQKSMPPVSTEKPPSIPPRPEASRNSSANLINGRLPHTLPSRPEPSYSRGADSRMPDRLTDRGLRDHSRDVRFPDRNGVDKPRDLMHERNVSGAQPRNLEPPTDRPHNAPRDRTSSSWGGEHSSGRLTADDRHGAPNSRDTRPPLRDERKDWSQRDRSFGETNHAPRALESQGPPSRDPTMAPPRSGIPQHPDRAALIHSGQDRGKPSFNSPHSDPHHEGNRYDRHANIGKSSRGPSPSRLDDRRTPRYEGRHDERPSNDTRQTFDEPFHGHPTRFDGNRLPTGPRTDRNGVQGSQDRFRDQSQNAATVLPANEQTRRSHHEPSYGNRQQESQYGRLNPGPEPPTKRSGSGPEVPSGPRLPNGNNASATRVNGRNLSGMHSQVSPQQAQHPSATPTNTIPVQDRQTPTGPSARGTPRNSLSIPKLDAAQSVPVTPAAESPDTAGVHPDRLRAIQGGANVAPGNVAQSPSTMGRPPLPPVSVPPPPGSRPPHGQLPSPGGPSPSPAGPLSASMGPSLTGRGPPTGPSSTNERSRGDRRMFAGLQNVLQQAGTPNAPERSSQGASIRGRGGRTNNMPVHSPSTSGPPTPSMPRVEQGRGEVFANRNNGPPGPPPVEDDLAYGRGTRRGPPREIIRDSPREQGRDGGREAIRDGGREPALTREEGREGERRSGRLRGSRDHSRDPGHASAISARDEERPPRRDDGRERGRQPMPGPSERDVRRPPRADEQRRPESDRRGMDGWGPDRRGGVDRRDDRDRREGGGSGRKRGRGGDDGRPYEDKRQRRVE